MTSIVDIVNEHKNKKMLVETAHSAEHWVLDIAVHYILQL